jgi:hypothetical protein
LGWESPAATASPASGDTHRFPGLKRSGYRPGAAGAGSWTAWKPSCRAAPWRSIATDPARPTLPRLRNGPPQVTETRRQRSTATRSPRRHRARRRLVQDAAPLQASPDIAARARLQWREHAHSPARLWGQRRSEGGRMALAANGELRSRATMIASREGSRGPKRKSPPAGDPMIRWSHSADMHPTLSLWRRCAYRAWT